MQRPDKQTSIIDGFLVVMLVANFAWYIFGDKSSSVSGILFMFLGMGVGMLISDFIRRGGTTSTSESVIFLLL